MHIVVGLWSQNKARDQVQNKTKQKDEKEVRQQ